MAKRKPRVYYYTDDEVGVPWPGPDADFLLPDGRKKYDVEHPRFVWYALPGFKETRDPAEADLFVVRQRLIWLDDAQVRALPYLRGNEQRHLFFDLGTDSDPRAFRTFPDIAAIFITATCERPMLAQKPDLISWPWPVDDLGEFVPLPDGGFRYDVVFQGQMVVEGEWMLAQSVRDAGLDVHLRKNPKFYGTMAWGTEEKQRLRREFTTTMAGARLSLCHRSNSHGVIRYRFYEALSMGRVPVLLCDDCVLPFAERIDYDRCCIRLKECDVAGAGSYLADWLGRHSDEEIAAMGRYGREVWETWLDRSRWAELVELVVRERTGL